MLTSQEAEISILEEELEKMAVVAGECSGRANFAEEQLKLVHKELADSNGKGYGGYSDGLRWDYFSLFCPYL